MTISSSVQHDAPVYDVDFTASAVQENPYVHWEEVRRLGPVVWNPASNGWLITGFSDVRKVLRDSANFKTDANFSVGWGGKVVATIDGEAHRQLKDIMRPAFERDYILDTWEAAVQSLVHDCAARAADKLREGTEVEVVKHFHLVPTATALLLLRISDDDVPDVIAKFQDWAAAMSESINAIYLADAAERASVLAKGEQARTAVHELAARLFAERVQDGFEPDDDIIRRLALSDVFHGDGVLSEQDARAQVAQLVGASQLNTLNNIVTCIQYLAENKNLRDELRDDRQLIPQFIEEVVRHSSVFAVTPRVVDPGPVEIHGITLQPGDRVYAVNSAANRDPSRWENPEVFDIHRPQLAHVGFGFGPHTCIGVNVARMETRLIIDAILDAFGDFEISRTFEYGEKFMQRGPKELYIRQV